MFKSIFGRLFWTYTLLVTIILSTISVSMAILTTQLAERKQIETLHSVANNLEFWTVTLEMEQKENKIAQDAYERSLNSWSNFSTSDITVIDRNGNVIHSTCGITSVPGYCMETIDTDSSTIKKSDFDGFYEHDVLVVTFPLHHMGNTIGAIIFNKRVPDIHRTAAELLVLFFISMLTSMAIAFIIIYVQAKKISIPIVKINKAAQNIAAGNFNERVEVTTKDEIGQLASSFNFMASSIERSEQNRQRFISDVSHELRTPMTSISGFVRGMLDGTIDEKDREAYLQIVLDESTRLTRLVNNMLEMSKMQSDDFELNIAPFSITELICACLIELEEKIESKSLDVNVDFRPEKLAVLGDKDQIKRVLINLLDNAVKFSHANTTISVNTRIEQGKAHIEVSNVGDGISDEDAKRIFDRFYKTDMSREKDRTGAGLGLSLVQNILRLHNQTIRVKSTENNKSGEKITTFEFTLEVK